MIPKLAAVCLSLASSCILSATLITFNTPTGATDSAGDPVNAAATFTTGAGTLSIAVMNKLTNQKDVGQNISDIAFFLDGKQTTGALSSSTTIARTITTGGAFSDSLVLVPAGFALQQNYTLGANTGFRLCDLCAGGSAPSNTIIGSPDTITNTYSNGNASIAKTGQPHNPFDSGTTTFNLTIAGVTAASTVTGATFSFGTTEGDNVTGVPVDVAAVPEPATEALLGGGLLGLALLAKKFRNV